MNDQLILLKAEVYDLLAMREQIDAALQAKNREISALLAQLRAAPAPEPEPDGADGAVGVTDG